MDPKTPAAFCYFNLYFQLSRPQAISTIRAMSLFTLALQGTVVQQKEHFSGKQKTLLLFLASYQPSIQF